MAILPQYYIQISQVDLQEENLVHITLNKFKEKSYTCEEGGAHLRISFWCLLMNLKNK